jgi:hypothetical protein
MEHAKPTLVYSCEASQLNNRTHMHLQERNYTNELARLGSHEYMNQQWCFEWLQVSLAPRFVYLPKT